MKRIILVLGVLGFLAAAAEKPFAAVGRKSASNRIETFASQMSSNTWQRIGTSASAGTPTATLKSLSVTPSATPRSAFEFSHNFFWNSDAKELHFRGGGASAGGGNLQRHFRYRDATGEWDAVTPWLTGQKWIHQWGHFCGDPRTGDLYFRRTGGDDIHKWTYQPYPWTSSDATGADSWPFFDEIGIVDPQTTGALGFFPDYNNGDGALVFCETYGGDYSVHASDADLATWSQIGFSVFPGETGGYENIITYCPGQKWMLFGGGKYSGGSTGRIAKFEADGTVTRLNDLPFIFGANSTGKIVAHPNGRIFGIDINGENLYEYNEGTDSWSTGSLTALPFTAHWNAACMIPEHDVIYVLAQLGGAATSTIEEWLYKFDPGSAVARSASPSISKGVITASIAPMPAAAGTRAMADVRLNTPGTVDISLMTVSGRKLKTLFSGSMKAGTSRTHLSLTGKTGRPLAAGTYLIGFGVNGTRKLTKRISVF